MKSWGTKFIKAWTAEDTFPVAARIWNFLTFLCFWGKLIGTILLLSSLSHLLFSFSPSFCSSFPTEESLISGQENVFSKLLNKDDHLIHNQSSENSINLRTFSLSPRKGTQEQILRCFKITNSFCQRQVLNGKLWVHVPFLSLQSSEVLVNCDVN